MKPSQRARVRMMMCLTLFVACSACSAFGVTLYVGPRETCTTIQAGVNAAQPGDTVIVRDGVYTDRTSIGYCNVGVNVTRGGTDEAHRITVKAEHEWGAVVDLQSEGGALGFRIGEGVCYVTIEGFEIRNCGRVSSSFDDWGVGKDPAVVFEEDFEVANLDELRTRWSELGTTNLADEKKTALGLDAGAPESSPGVKTLRITATKDEDSGGFAYKVLPGGYDRLFFRFYVKFADDYGFCHHFAGMRGSVEPLPVLRGAAGVRPENSWSSLADAEASYVLTPVPPPGIWHFYTYWPEMRSWQNEYGTANQPLTEDAYYGNCLDPEPPVPVVRGKWICVEMMVQMNSSPEKADGEQALWIDGKLVAHFAPESVRGRWSYDRFLRDERGKPFGGFRWRRDLRVKANAVFLRNYVSGRSFGEDEAYARKYPDFRINIRQATVWFDHMVVSREYVGPLR